MKRDYNFTFQRIVKVNPKNVMQTPKFHTKRVTIWYEKKGTIKISFTYSLSLKFLHCLVTISYWQLSGSRLHLISWFFFLLFPFLFNLFILYRILDEEYKFNTDKKIIFKKFISYSHVEYWIKYSILNREMLLFEG